MIKNAYRYTQTIVNGEKIIADTGNNYVMVSQRPYRGKQDATGKEIIKPGVTVTLQIVEDHSEPITDDEGRVLDDNVLETFDATIIGASYPLSLKKGARVCLKGFLPEISYFVNFSLILRFSAIEALDGKVKD